MANNDLIQLSESEQKHLKDLVKKADFTQEEFAEKVNISLDDYKRVIGTKKDKPDGVSRYLIEKIAKALNKSATDFIDPDKWFDNKIKQYRSGFQALIDEKTRRFVGRQFVFDKFQEFINTQKQGYFTLVGDPGEGKSAIASHYIKDVVKYQCLYYFNVYSDSNNRADQFLKNICNQLIAYYQLDYKDLPPEATEDGNFFKKLLEEVSKKLGVGEKLIIVIDAL
ncbi:MAG TPA: hypothetical protein V6C58_22200, partial [Allocoleopsis sp.]